MKRLYAALLIVALATFAFGDNRVKTFVSGETLTASDLNNEFDNTWNNVTHTVAGTWTFTKAGTPITITPGSAPSANTVLLDINNTGGTNLWSIDYEGDIVRAGTDTWTIDDATTNATTTFSTVTHTTSGTAAAGLGIRLLYRLEDAAGNTDNAGALDFQWSDATSTSEDADLVVSLTAGGSLTGLFKFLSTGNLEFEGATADAFETTFAIADPTADRTITFADAAGTVALGTGAANRIAYWSGTNALTSSAAFTFDGTTFQVGTNQLYVNTSGFVAINDTSNASLTIGLTINQGANDDHIFELKSSDVAHGITGQTETDSYADIAKYSATEGGLNLRGFTEATVAYQVQGAGVTDDTTKSTAAVGYIVLSAEKKNGTGFGTAGADANLVVIRNDTTARFIFDAEGSFHADVESTTFDAYDDAALLDSFDKIMMERQDKIGDEFRQFLKYNERDLEAAGLVKFNPQDKRRAMVNWTKMSMLHTGAIRQAAQRMEALEARVAQLEAQR